MDDLLPTITCWLFIPTNENNKVTSGARLDKLKFPFASVIEPVVVPLTTTETPGSELPEESVTLPVTDFCCWTLFVSAEKLLLCKSEGLIRIILLLVIE